MLSCYSAKDPGEAAQAEELDLLDICSICPGRGAR